MDGITNKNQLAIFEEYEFNNPLIQKIDSRIDISKRDCHNKYFHTFDHLSGYDLSFTNNTDNETVSFQFPIKAWVYKN